MTTEASPRVCAVVVTYNRQELLLCCLAALCRQNLPPDKIIVVDNASTDGTPAAMAAYAKRAGVQVEYVRLEVNTGGAGGFKHGLHHAVNAGAQWVWLMDDDAEPHPTALAELMMVAANPTDIYGSVATNGEDICWATTLLEPERRVVNHLAQMPDKAHVQSLPFLGFLIHCDLVRTIGLPDDGFVIAADDVEYCLRAQRAGAQIIIAGKSHIEHPKTDIRVWRFFGTSISYLGLAPWKRYYDTRNRILIARKYYGLRLLTQTIPGSFVRLLAALRFEPRKLAQLGAFCAGLVDGLLGIKGPRHIWWGIRQ
jgi:GT2 family glycosyltransferase